VGMRVIPIHTMTMRQYRSELSPACTADLTK
jgi:hypothetical protein